MRIAIPVSCRASAEAALGLVPTATRPNLLFQSASRDNSWHELDYQRILLERHAARGWGVDEANHALRDSSVRAVLALLDRKVDAALFTEDSNAEWRLAWHLLEPGRQSVCTDLWIGELPLGQSFAWLDWPNDAELSKSVARLVSAAQWVRQAHGCDTQPVLVNFAGGKNPQQPQIARFAATLQERLPCLHLELYSPLLFHDGRPKVSAVLAAVRREFKSSTPQMLPVLCIPQLMRTEWAECVLSEGGCWAGMFRAGAERLAARVEANAGPDRWSATLRWITQLRNA